MLACNASNLRLLIITLACLVIMQVTGAAPAGATPKPDALPSAQGQTGAPFRQTATDRSPADRAFLDAFRAQQSDRLIQFELAARQVPADHLLADYLGYWRLRLQLRSAGQPEASLDAAVRAFIRLNPKSIPGDLLRRQWMLKLAERGQWAEMLSHLPHWRRRNDTRVLCRAGQARMMLGKAPGSVAMRALQRDRDLGEDCGEFARLLLAREQIDSSFLRRRLWLALEVRDWKSVRLLAGLLGSDESQVEQSLKQSLALIQAAVAPVPPANLDDAIDRNTLLIALVSHSRPKPSEAAAWMASAGQRLTPAEQRFVWSQIAASAMRDMIPQAYDYAQKAVASGAHDITRRWLARAALRQQDWRLLDTFIHEMAPGTQTQSTWVYWRARAMLARGELNGGQALFEQIAERPGFYGALAAEELGRPVQLPIQQSPEPGAGEMAAATRLPGLKRAFKFYDLGLKYRGNREWSLQLRGLSDRRLLAVAALACQRQLAERCLATAARTRKLHDYQLRYMTPFRPTLEPLALSNGLDPAWVYGLIHQESRFDIRARSSVGARGLMQIMPSTGRWIAGRLGQQNFETAHLYHFATNVQYGTYYLKTVYDSLNNSALLASAGYNAGPRRPRYWQSTLPDTVDGALFAEIIPFAQTRQYVKKVLLNAAYYGSVFEGKPQSLKTLLGTVPKVPFKPSSIP